MDYDNTFLFKENMPQIVPAEIYFSDTYAVYADNFDLSMLSMEEQLRPNSQSSTSDYIPATVFHDIQIKEENISWSSDMTVASKEYQTTALIQKLQHDDLSRLDQNQQEHFLKVYPPSPTPSIEIPLPISLSNSILYNNINIKQEYIGLFPPSPPDSNGALSPRSDIKSEPETSSDSETFKHIDDLFQNKYESFNPSTPNYIKQQQQIEPQQQQNDHLLREHLLDTSFQRKHNLKPLALESLFCGWGTSGDIEPVISMALEHVKKDVQKTCTTLNISPDPQQWTQDHVQLWLHSTIEQFKLPAIIDLKCIFPEDGNGFYRLTDEEFIKRIPQAGGTLYAQLEIWKAACTDIPQPFFYENQLNSATTSIPWSLTENLSVKDTDVQEEEMSTEFSTIITAQQQEIPPELSMNLNPLTITIKGIQSSVSSPVTKTGRQSSSHIHLWQFLKELLASTQLHGTAIRWLDRSKGIFKIEDSIRVARLWGRRKNRPAMNYDKLSRSIRQYYKKGIMKKTERSQRLVYQFCHPYCL